MIATHTYLLTCVIIDGYPFVFSFLMEQLNFGEYVTENKLENSFVNYFILCINFTLYEPISPRLWYVISSRPYIDCLYCCLHRTTWYWYLPFGRLKTRKRLRRWDYWYFIGKIMTCSWLFGVSHHLLAVTPFTCGENPEKYAPLCSIVIQYSTSWSRRGKTSSHLTESQNSRKWAHCKASQYQPYFTRKIRTAAVLKLVCYC